MKMIKKFLFLTSITLFSFNTFPSTQIEQHPRANGKILPQNFTRTTNPELLVSKNLRLALLADDQLSTEARNIIIKTDKNAIILEGHVTSKAEKVKIENLARARAGKNRVYNRLTY